jgi:hypothetical protein
MTTTFEEDPEYQQFCQQPWIPIRCSRSAGGAGALRAPCTCVVTRYEDARRPARH